MLASGRRASAVRRYPPGCGRHHRLATTAAAETKPTLANPSSRAATNTLPPPERRTLLATASFSFGAEAPNRSVGNGRKAAAAVTVPRVWVVRRYPPGCGRGIAVFKPSDSEDETGSEDGAGKPSAVVGNGDGKARACDGEVMLRASALDGTEFRSNGGMTNGGDGDAGAQVEGGGNPWEVTGLMAVPFLPWAQHERRSQRASS